jgi:hypothetical protein
MGSRTYTALDDSRSLQRKPRIVFRGSRPLTAIWIVVLVVFFALRLIRGEAVINQDELIPLRVADAMSARGILDPNWNFADLGLLKYDSYNFYLYNILAFLLITPAQWLGLPPLGALRVANLLMQLAAMWLARDALRRLGADARAQLFVCALIAVAPGLVQDAYMARPETLTYLLVALLIWILTLEARLPMRMGWAGLVVGAGMAVKVTFATAGVLALIPLAEGRGVRDLRGWALCLAVLGVAAVIGFTIAAPFALIHPLVYLDGLAHLAAQYRDGHPPHSQPVYSFSSQAFWILRYFVELYGPLLLIALLGPIWLRGRKQWWAFGLGACWLVLAAYFATQRVFFERNFAHGLLPLLVAAALVVGAVRSSSMRHLLSAAVLIPMSYWSLQIAIAARSPFGSANYESSNHLTVTRRLTDERSVADLLGPECGTIAVIEYNDARSREYVSRLEQAGFKLVGRYRGRFAPLVTSTLQVYLDPGVYYLQCPKSLP